MKPDPLEKLRIPDQQRARRNPAGVWIFAGIAIALGLAVFFAWPRKSDASRVVRQTTLPATPQASASPTVAALPDDGIALTTSGYIINRERIELSPRFVGVVKWMGVRKGDHVKKDQVVVLLDDAEQQARVAEARARLSRAEASREISLTRLARLKRLREQRVESQQELDNTEAEVRAADAGVHEAEASLELAKVALDWTVIRSPVDGVVLEKLADENELVSPQSFGGDKGPSTALIAVADMNDLQVEIDVNETDLARVSLGQACRITPEAFGDKSYSGVVAEIAPEANRQKGTLQIRVQVQNPDRWLVPELSAKVDFLSANKTK